MRAFAAGPCANKVPPNVAPAQIMESPPMWRQPKLWSANKVKVLCVCMAPRRAIIWAGASFGVLVPWSVLGIVGFWGLLLITSVFRTMCDRCCNSLFHVCELIVVIEVGTEDFAILHVTLQTDRLIRPRFPTRSFATCEACCRTRLKAATHLLSRSMTL